ncbi:MAG: ABC transporter transmembrane domain-containing protein [Cyanobacteria bacterium J06635_1]
MTQTNPTAETAVISQLIAPNPLPTQAATELATAVKQHSYQLGEMILDGSPTSLQHEIYWVHAGWVRLLCDIDGQAVTALRLGPGKIFGADDYFLEHPFTYRVIASSPHVEIANLPIEQLHPFLEQEINWRVHLLRQAQQIEQMIFFKHFTTLRSHPSQELSQWVPHLEEHRIPQGANLREATPNHAGRFWLRWGEIREASPENKVKGILEARADIPTQGSSWGYPDSVSDRWVAACDLVIYCLPIEKWEIAKALVPDFITGEPLNPEFDPSNLLTNTQQLQAAKQITTEALESPAVVFPKPIRRQLLDRLARYPWIEQQSSSDCGIACLAMICRYWGKRFPINVLRERANVGQSGASLKSLAKAAEDVGFQARPVRASLGALINESGPWIAHWEGMHYVVVYQVSAQKVVIADPALGRQTLSRAAFCQKWTGYALLLQATDKLRQTNIKQASLGRYIAALVPHRGILLQIIIVSLLIQSFSLVTPLFTQVVLDKVVVQKSLPTLNVFALGMLLFGVWGIGMSAVRQYLLSYFSNRLDLTLVSGFINHAMSLPLKFFESRRVGDIITRVQENQKIQRFLIGQVVLAWLNFVTGFVYLALMLHYNWRLTLMVLLLVPPIVILTLGSTPFLRRVSRQIFKEAADQNSALVEMMNGMSTIKAAATERELRWRWEDHLTRQMNARFRGQKLGIGLQTLSGIINTLGSTALLWYGAKLVIENQLTIGQFVAFNMMMGYVISPVLALANLWDELQEVFISVERLNDVFETQPEQPAEAASLPLPRLKGDVEVEAVTFRYNEEDERNTLQNLSFRVRAGATIAIVGRSGSGKSTLIKLMEGLYHPTQGRVLIDGNDLRHVSLPSLRSQLGVVPQDCFLFSGTLLDNITLHRADWGLEDAIAAAKLAEAHSFIQAMPLGYSTKVGERGATLSGGQRQRIAIARALLGDPRILILDEATSSLDTESERRFQQNLESISCDRTTFIIAHRLSTVRNADTILVLDRGILVEQGNHAELMAKQGLYYGLAQQQLAL